MGGTPHEPLAQMFGLGFGLGQVWVGVESYEVSQNGPRMTLE